MSTPAELFEKASRLKVRFSTILGLILVEDLWDLPLTSAKGRANLDDIARSLNKEIKEADEVSFVTPATGASTVTKLKFDIVMHVISTLIAERDAAVLKAAAAAKRQKILGLIAQREEGQLAEMSLDDLKAMLEETPAA